MALNYDQQIVLKAELNTDPMSLGYAGKDTNACAELLNTAGLSAETIPNTTVLVDDIMLAIDPDEVSNIHVNKMQFVWEFMRGKGSLDISQGSGTRAFMRSVFTVADAPNTRIALEALKDRDATRGEILFGIGITITHTDVGRARQVV